MPARSGPVEAQLVAEPASVRPGTPFTAALVLRMDPGWHVYWKNPGDSGLPTTIDWDLPAGFSAGPITWPVPERIVTADLVTYGYSGQVLLLAEITPPANLGTGTPLILKARAGWLACRVECTPGKADLTLSLPVRPSLPSADVRWADAFRAARISLPAMDPSLGLAAEADNNRIVLHASGLEVPPGSQALFLPGVAGTIRDSAPQEAGTAGRTLTLRMLRPSKAAPLSRLEGLLLVSGPERRRGFAVDVPVVSLKNATSLSALSGFAARPGGFLLAVILAFAGGILLNLMPCVLPVISLKVLSFVRQSGGVGKGVLTHGLLFTGGVLVSFWVIVGILVALRAGGRLLGWGFQFQNPSVVGITAVLFFLIGLSLFGVFEIGSAFTRMGSRFASRTGGAGSFLSGLFATAVATPCTAPFMGSAIGYALSRPLPVAFGVFTAVALGMAAPYLLLSASPRLIARLPKPGPWMETLRQVMGFPMMGAVIWMLFVLSALAGSSALLALLSAILAAGLGAWIWGRWGGIGRPRGTRIAAGLLALVLALGGPALALVSFPAARAPGAGPAGTGRQPGSTVDSFWQAWSPETVAQLRRQGAPVFVDFTARWCLSCQVNERLALDNPTVRSRFRELGVATLRADWTDKNDPIAQAIAGYGRAGVPVYVLYGRGAQEPVLLPELLTPAIVLGALDTTR